MYRSYLMVSRCINLLLNVFWFIDRRAQYLFVIVVVVLHSVSALKSLMLVVSAVCELAELLNNTQTT